MPDVSVVIPAFNVAPYIAEALDSVLAQDVAGLDVEIVVVDDGSTDGTGDIVKTYGESVVYTSIPHSGRAGAARNHGIRRTTGRYLAFLDGDDFWLASSLKRRVELLEEQPHVGLVHGNYYTGTDDARRVQFDVGFPPSGGVFHDLFRANFVHTSSVVARRTLVDAVGAFHPHVRYAEDYWLWLQLAGRSEVAFVKDPVSVYRVRSNSLSGDGLTAKLPDLMRVVTEIALSFDVPIHMVRERLNPLRIWLAKEQLRQGHYASAARNVLTALCSAPLPVLRGHLRARAAVESAR